MSVSLLSVLAFSSHLLTLLTLLRLTQQTLLPFLQYKILTNKSQAERLSESQWKRKLVLITGATSGIGEEMARKLNGLGASLILTGRNTQKLSSLQNELGENVKMTLEADLTSLEGVQSLSRRVLGSCVKLDVLVLNAGRSTIKSFDQYDLNELDSDGRDIMELNFFSPVFMCKLLEPILRKGCSPAKKAAHSAGGHVLVTSSVAGRVGVYNRTMYCASKFAVNGFFEALRREWEGKIAVSVICPGFVTTNIHFNALGAEKGTVKRDLRKFITPENCVEHMLLMVEKNVPFRTIPLSKEFLLGYVSWLMPDALKTYFIKKENVVKVEQ
uniref:Uncharacterized protein n=1 Tax=Percolomonas cosmopolitus TaxID=63605 RepID=A0A7S1PIS2_9EUKA|mmetsp:Transcript_4852/g.18159  ORF Transcript_4852/g.18159 Transcript_4852/m.18159 type:complete len:328 (+) Transcript_4852:62-1045(+)